MTSPNRDLQVEWIVACLAPADLAPHPNFRAESATPPELMALITQFKWNEYISYRDSSTEDVPEFGGSAEDQLLRAAMQSLNADEIAAGRDSLVVLAQDERLSVGARAAAVLLASVADAELDQPAEHSATIEAVIQLLEVGSRRDSASERLIMAALLQQAAVRHFEAGRADESRVFAERAIASLAGGHEAWDEFPVSRGISWDSTESQQRLVELLAMNARSLVSTVSPIGDRAWIEIVRAPFPAGGTRRVRDLESGLTDVIESQFGAEYGGRRRTVKLGGDFVPARTLYAAALNAELVGGLSEMGHSRQILGNVVALGDPASVRRYGEAIRLLRQSDSVEYLRDLLYTIRMQGPLEELKAATEQLIAIRSTQGYATAADLVLIGRGADVISDDIAVAAVDIAVNYASYSHDGRIRRSEPLPWKRIELSLTTLAALANGNPTVDMNHLAQRALEIVRDFAIGNAPAVLAAVATLSDQLDWESVDEELTDFWFEMVLSASESANVLAIDLVRVFDALGRPIPDQVRQSLSGLQLAVAVASGLLGVPDDATLASVISTVSEVIESIRDDASKGITRGHAWSPLSLAVYLIWKFDRVDLWSVVVNALSDNRVGNREKVDALNAIAVSGRRLSPPEDVSRALAALSPVGDDEQRDPLFGIPNEQYEASIRSACLSLGIVQAETAQEGVVRNAASPDPQVRGESARCCAAIVAHNDGLEWPVVLLLQLSYDRDPMTKNVAARGLGSVSTLGNVALLELVRARVRALLSEPGIAIPLGVLQGLLDARNDQSVSSASSWYVPEVRLALSHPSRAVRRAAAVVLGVD